MTNKLNEEYFKARENHKQNNISKLKYIIWFTLCIIVFASYNFLFNKAEIPKTVDREKEIVQQQKRLSDNLLTKDSIISFYHGEYQVSVLKNYSFSEISSEGPLIISANDLSEANVIIQFMKKDIHLKEFIKDFRAKIPSYDIVGDIVEKQYKKGNYMEKCEVIFSKNGVSYYGSVYVLKKGNRCFLIQGTSTIDSWKLKSADIYSMIDSFFVLNKG